MTERYHVEERKVWSYIVDGDGDSRDGPWRYRWEAEEQAERLNRLYGEEQSR